MADTIDTTTQTTQTQPQEQPQEEQTAASRQSLMGFSGWGTLRTPKDTLELEYPALATQIREALTKGWDRNTLRRFLAEREITALTQYSMDEVNQFLGRNENTRRELWTAMKHQRDDAYVQIMKYDMSEDRVRDILRTAELSKIAPGVLLLNPDVLPVAEKLAGERRGAFGQVAGAVSNLFSNWIGGVSEKEHFTAQDIRELANRNEFLLAEGLRVWDASHSTGFRPSDEELIEMGRQSYEELYKPQIELLEEASREHAQTSREYAVHMRPPDSAITTI